MIMFSVKRERKIRHLTAVEFAALVGVKRNAVYCWERGGKISADSAIKMSLALNIPLETILNVGVKKP